MTADGGILRAGPSTSRPCLVNIRSSSLYRSSNIDCNCVAVLGYTLDNVFKFDDVLFDINSVHEVVADK